VSYLRQPLVLALEIVSLIMVSAHALLGVRAVLIDLGPGQRVERLINLGLGLAAVGMVAYGIDLVLAIVR
jgi:succinate dehydrogenase hydrophobic anchor subunit